MIMDIQIEVVSIAITERKGKSKATGSDYHIATQEAYVHKGERYPEKIEIPAVRTQGPTGYSFAGYPIGFYSLSASNLVVRDGRLSIDLYSGLTPATAQPAKPARAA